jgi:hypothetical protein
MTWLVNSPFARMVGVGPRLQPVPFQIEPLGEIEWKLATLASLPDSAGPILAFLHLLSPHEPYLFNADCSEGEPWVPATDQGENFQRVGQAYSIQVKCLNQLVLRTVTLLIKRSRTKPVIILTADHGQGRIYVNPFRGITLRTEEATAEQIGEHLGIFAAYLFPGADSSVYPDISPVNVMPLVLQSLFGEPASLLPDHSYWSTAQDPANLVEVSGTATRPPAAQTR